MAYNSGKSKNEKFTNTTTSLKPNKIVSERDWERGNLAHI